jgi:hypothetical protein
MSTKAEIETVIDTNLASVSDITAIEHRNTWKDNANNMLDTMYGTEITDTDATQTWFVLDSPGIASFDFRFVKQGREVEVTGEITAISTFNKLGSFVAGDLTVATGGKYYGTGFNLVTLLVDGDIVVTSLANGLSVEEVSTVTSLFVTDSLNAGETLFFTIKYNTEN